MDGSNRSWDLPKIRSLFRPATAIKICQTPLKWSGGPNSFWWPLTKAGDYIVKTGYYEVKKANQFGTYSLRGNCKRGVEWGIEGQITSEIKALYVEGLSQCFTNKRESV